MRMNLTFLFFMLICDLVYFASFLFIIELYYTPCAYSITLISMLTMCMYISGYVLSDFPLLLSTIRRDVVDIFTFYFAAS